MGQCMSRKAVAAFTTSAVAIHQQNYRNMSKHLMSPEEETKPAMKKATSKGIATSFGFRKKSATSPSAPPSRTLTANNPSAARRLANAVDDNGNSGGGGATTEASPVAADETARLTTNAVPTGRSTPHRLPAPKKEAHASTKPSRFGFRQPNANRLQRVADVDGAPPPTRIECNGNATIESEIKAKVETQRRALMLDSNRNVGRTGAKYTLHANQLPRPQQPVRLLESKTAKTLANNSRKRGQRHDASGDESYFTEDSGVGSNCGDREQHIEQLEKSPTARRARDVWDAANAGLARGIVAEKLQRLEAARTNSFTSSDASEVEERRATHDYKQMEKIARFIKKPQTRTPQTRTPQTSPARRDAPDGDCDDEQPSVATLITAKASDRLSLVDPQFAAIAELHRTAPLILDEPSPVDSINCSSDDAKDVDEKRSSSAGSPTNGSRSLSSSDGRDDFLIDDEIADQPALLFDDTITNSNQPSEATPTLVDVVPAVPSRKALAICESSPMALTNRRFGAPRAGSLDTLSPCESIASDDCMMDYDLSSGIEDANDRTETNSHFTLDDMPLPMRAVDLKITNVMRDWSSLLAGCDIPRDASKRMSFRSTRLLRSRGGTPTPPPPAPDSPRSDATRRTPLPPPSPLRLASRASTGAGYDSDDSAVIRIDRTVVQDVMGLKAGLLKLKRVLHEPANEDYLMRSETRNSLSENGFFNGYGSDSDDRDAEEAGVREEMANLRRQVVYLQGQLDDAERATKTLRQEVISLSLKCESSQSAPASVGAAAAATPAITCNAATQTERIRPISAGPALLRDADDSTPGSLVSASERNGAHTSPPTTGRTRPSTSTKAAPPSPGGGRLWRMPGEPPSPSAIPRRSRSRSRVVGASLAAAPFAATPT